MTEQILKESVLELINEEDIDIALFDIFNDEITKFKYQNGSFVSIDKLPLTSYLEDLKNKVEEQYLKEYMNVISIPRLEENEKNGNNNMKTVYKTLNNETFSTTTMLVNLENKKQVLVITKHEDLNNVSTKNEENIKFNTLIDSLSDTILKVQNVFGMEEKSLSSIKNVEEYINSLFSSLYSNYPELKKALNKTAANVTGRCEDVILIVDDDMVMRNMIKKVFDGDYKIVTVTNGKEAIEYLDENKNKGINEATDHVVGIFLDLTMPVMDGFAVLEYLSKKNYLSRIPVIIISGDYEKETKQRVYSYNVADMLEKPFDFEVVKHRIGNFINLYKSSNSLNDLINDQNKDLKELINSFVDSYFHDYENNITLVGNYIEILCKKISDDYPEYLLDENKINKIKDASRYYDVGFNMVPKSILNKGSGFTEDEINIVKNYPLISSKIIDYILSLTSDEVYKSYATNIAMYYHENYDGTGYPSGLKADEIPLEAQIASIAIMYNNLQRKGRDNAKDIIISKSGVMFNPKLVGSFMKVINELEKVV